MHGVHLDWAFRCEDSVAGAGLWIVCDRYPGPRFDFVFHAADIASANMEKSSQVVNLCQRVSK